MCPYSPIRNASPSCLLYPLYVGICGHMRFSLTLYTFAVTFPLSSSFPLFVPLSCFRLLFLLLQSNIPSPPLTHTTSIQQPGFSSFRSFFGTSRPRVLASPRRLGTPAKQSQESIDVPLRQQATSRDNSQLSQAVGVSRRR